MRVILIEEYSRKRKDSIFTATTELEIVPVSDSIVETAPYSSPKDALIGLDTILKVRHQINVSNDPFAIIWVCNEATSSLPCKEIHIEKDEEGYVAKSEVHSYPIEGKGEEIIFAIADMLDGLLGGNYVYSKT